MIASLFLILVLVVILACLEAHHRVEREEVRRRQGCKVAYPQRVKDRDLPPVIPEFCQLCDRPMSLPVGVAKVEALSGHKSSIYCCSYCLALGGLDSAISAAAEQAAPTSCTDLAQPCSPSSAPGLPVLPGGSPAAGTF